MKTRLLIMVILASVLMFLVPMHLKAQSRQNKVLPVKIMKSSPILTDIDGWMFDGEYWCGYKNVLLREYKRNSKIPIQTTVFNITESGRGNIASLQTKQIMLNNTVPYYLLYITSWSYYFDYPEIEMGRHNRKDITIYGINKKEWDNMWTMADTTTIRIQVELLGGYWPQAPSKEWGATTEREVIKDCFKHEFNPYIESDNEFTGWKFYVKRVGNAVRFFIPTMKNLREDMENFSKKYPNRRLWDSDFFDFENMYFEMPYQSFLKLKL